MLDRLRSQKSYYDSTQYRDHTQKHEQILRIRSDYPEQYDHPNNQDSKRRLSTQRGSMQKGFKFRNHGFRQHQGMLNNPFQMDMSRREMVTQGGELVTHPPDLQTDDEMQELIKEVKSAEDDLRGKKAHQEQQTGQNGHGVLHSTDEMRFKSDLQESNRITPEQLQKVKMHQTVSHFHSRQQSGNDQTVIQPVTTTKDTIQLKQDIANQYQNQYRTPIYAQQVPWDFDQVRVQSVKPLYLKHQGGIDPQRIVLYREDVRPIETVDYTIRHAQRPKHYIVEVSRSRYKMYIIAVKIPKKYFQLILNGRAIYHLAQQPQTKVYYADMTEKQGRKLLQECQNNFKQVLDMLYIQFERLHIQDFDNIMRFGGLASEMAPMLPINSQMQTLSQRQPLKQQPSLQGSQVKLRYQYQSQPHKPTDPTILSERVPRSELPQGQFFTNKNQSVSPPDNIEIMRGSKRYHKVNILNSTAIDKSRDNYGTAELRQNNEDFTDNVKRSYQQIGYSNRRLDRHFPLINSQRKQSQVHSSMNAVPGNWEVVKSPKNNQLVRESLEKFKPSRNDDPTNRQQINSFVESYIDAGNGLRVSGPLQD